MDTANIFNAKILIVDDLEENVRLHERMLRAAGFTAVASTMDPHAVAELHRKNRYDLILLDLVMPGMDGFEVMDVLKQIETDSYLPVLVVTAEPSHKIRALNAGAKDFISQPIDFTEALTRVKNLLEVRLLHTSVRQHGENLERINRELDWFSQAVSHDLRTPLRLMSKLVHLLLDEHGEQLPTGAIEKLQRVLDSFQEMGKLVENLLEFSQLNGEPRRKTRVDLRQLAGEALDELQLERQGREVEVVIDEIPPCFADRAILKQVFLNLLANALKFTRPCERAKIEVGFTQPKAEIVYFVRDNGVGFDMSRAESMFLLFHRFHSQFEGSGIGLALVKRMIERHGGQIWAEGQSGKGASFYFTLGQ